MRPMQPPVCQLLQPLIAVKRVNHHILFYLNFLLSIEFRLSESYYLYNDQCFIILALSTYRPLNTPLRKVIQLMTC